MKDSQTIQPARALRSLRVLLLVCAGALLIIVVTLASAIDDARQAQTAHATQPANGACGLPAQTVSSLPLALQPQLKEDCALLAEPEVR